MKKILGLALALASGWIVLGAESTTEPPAPVPPAPAKGVPPPPSAPLEIDGEGDETLAQLLERLAALSGVSVEPSVDARRRLSETRVPVRTPLRLDPPAAWPVVEQLLVGAECLLVEHESGFGVESFQPSPTPPGVQHPRDSVPPRPVTLAELAELEDHAALYVALELELRDLLWKESRLGPGTSGELGADGWVRRMIVIEVEVGPRRLRISGGASWVADRAALLLASGAAAPIEVAETRVGDKE